MRDIKYIVLHCTATPQSTTVESILHYWKNNLGWTNPGYHYLIKPDGEAVNLQPIEKPSNGVAGYNANSIHISYIGGVDARGRAIDNRTAAQKQTMKRLVDEMSRMFPKAIVQGHRDFSPDKNKNGIIEPSEWMKTCPSFEVKDWLKEINFKSKAEPVYLKTTTGVNIRTGGGTSFPLAGKALEAGVLVQVLGEDNGWSYVEVECTKQLGWIKSNYLK